MTTEQRTSHHFRETHRPAPTAPETPPPPVPEYPPAPGSTYGRRGAYEPLGWFDALAGPEEAATWATWLEGR